MKKILSTSKSDPAAATISDGTITVLPTAASKKCHTSAPTITLALSVGILGPVIVITSLCLANHSSFLIISFKRSMSPIGCSSLCFKFNKFKKSPLSGIATFIKLVFALSPVFLLIISPCV